MILLAAPAALLGIGWVQLQPELLSLSSFAGPAGVAMLLWLALMTPLPKAWRAHALPQVLRQALILIVVSMACAAFATWMAQRALGERLPAALDRESVWMEAVIRDLPARHERGWRLEVEAIAAQLQKDDDSLLAGFPMRGVLHWYANETAFIPQDIRPGERWAFQVRLRAPGGALNPGGFDMEAWMLEKGLQFTATVQQGKNAPHPKKLGHRDQWQDRLDGLRDDIRRSINEGLADRESRHVLAALVVGDQRAIAASDWRIFQRTGVSHLMSISGLHVTMLAALAAMIGVLFWKAVCLMSMRMGVLVPAQSLAAAFAIMGAWGYALLAGFAIPAQRTAIMVAVCSGARLLGIRANPWAVIAWALLAIIIPYPMAVLAPGFWLSFVAVAFLFSLSNADDDRHGWPWHRRVMTVLRSATHAQLGITLALMPLVVMLFQQVSVIGPIANAVAIPVVSYLVTPLAMMGAVESMTVGSSYGLSGADAAMLLLADFLKWCAQLKWAVLDWPAPGLISTIAASLGVMLAAGNVLQGRARSWRHWGWLGLLLVVGASPASPRFGEMQVRAIDVGQGSAVLVRTQSHALLFDTGPMMGESDAGERMVMPTLRRLGVLGLDRLVVSHFDRDHSGGLASVLAMTDVRALMVPFEDEARGALQGHAFLQSGDRIEQCRWGDQWRWDGVHFMVLHPSVPRGGRNRNQDSCVLRIEDRFGGSILLTGDIPIAAERRLVAQFTMLRDPAIDPEPHPDGAKLASNVLVAPHHGSNTSTGRELLAVVTPSLIVIQAGYHNRFGHPHAEVLDRIASASATNPHPIAVARNDLQGALDIRWEQGRPKVQDFWQEHRRYWHAQRMP